MTVNYTAVDQLLGEPGLSVTGDTTQRIALGHIIYGRDATYGIGEFMYVKFTGTVAAGDLVVVDRFAFTATQSPTTATKGNYGLAMAAQANGAFGYVMVRGVHDGANVLTGTTVQYGPTYGSALNAGRITSAVTSGYIIETLAVKASGASNVGTVELYWPSCSGR